MRDYCLFGWHGNQINCTDGNYVYMRGGANPQNSPLYEYTLMPTHIKSRFSVEELQNFTLQEPFSFTKGCKTMKIEVKNFNQHYRYGTKLYNIKEDYHQTKPIIDDEIELLMAKKMVELMKEADAPLEQFERVGLPSGGELTTEDIRAYREKFEKEYALIEELEKEYLWKDNTKEGFKAFVNLMNFDKKEKLELEFLEYLEKEKTGEIGKEELENFVKTKVTEDKKAMIMYFLNLLSRRD